jgi:hypothetical protein
MKGDKTADEAASAANVRNTHERRFEVMTIPNKLNSVY